MPSEPRPSSPAEPAEAASPLPVTTAPARPLVWRVNAGLFLATVASVFVTQWNPDEAMRPAMRDAGAFTASLLAILLAHEFGHYIAARIHKVDASLPFFIPLPVLSPFGTMGAVIRMRSAIPTRRALLDIGAAGPLAGLVVALPLYAWGAAHSHLVPLSSAGDGLQLGDSLLLRLLDHWFSPAVPSGMDLSLSPVAFAAWTGMFVTMINLLPAGQLDGGHVAYSLFGSRQNRIAQWVHRSMLVFFLVSVGSFVARDARAGAELGELGRHLGEHVNDSLFWLVWFEVLAVLGAVTTRGSRGGAQDEGSSPLGMRTRVFGTVGLALLAGIFHDSASPVLWIAWFGGLGVLLAMEVKWGALRESSVLLDHPPTSDERLSTVRALVAAVTLAFFPLLFMPIPMAM